MFFGGIVVLLLVDFFENFLLWLLLVDWYVECGFGNEGVVVYWFEGGVGVICFQFVVVGGYLDVVFMFYVQLC